MFISSAFPPSVRILLKNWKLAAIAILSLSVALALGIAGFGMFDAILLLPPFSRDPARLVSLFTISQPDSHDGASYPDYVYLRDHNTVFSGLAGLPNSVSKEAMTMGDRYFMASVNPVADNYFEVMGLRPAQGALFKRGDGDRKEKFTVITYNQWQRLGGHSNIVGQTVTTNHVTLTIIGVTQRGYTGPIFGLATDFLTLVGTMSNNGQLTERNNRWIAPVGRLKPGVTLQQARAEIESLWRQLAQSYPKDEEGVRIDVRPTKALHPDLLPDARLISVVVLLIMGLTLLVACSNVANLLLAIAATRAQETLIKSALGATRWRIIRDFLTESAILSLSSGALGYALAWLALRRISRFTMDLPVYGAFEFAHDLHPSPLVGAFALGLIGLAAFASGFAPALHSSNPRISGALSGEIAIGGTKKGVMRNTIAAVQVAICTLVLIGVGLCWRSLSNLRHVVPGYSARNLITVMVDVGANDLTGEKATQAYANLRRGALETYGVEAAALTIGTELGGDEPRAEVRLPADAPAPANTADKLRIPYDIVDEHYFSTLGVPLLSGRDFNSGDREKSPSVIVVNRKFAETYWPGKDPLGQSVRLIDYPRVATVVGVVADGKYGDLDQPIHPFFYLPLSQVTGQNEQVVICRTQGDPKNWIEPLAQMTRRQGLKLFFEPQTFDTWTNLSLFLPILTLRVVASLSVIALLLAAVGLYGTIYYTVSERRREIGIRVALGALPHQLFSMVVRRSSIVAGIGVAAGSMLGVGITLLFEDQFFGIRALEWRVLAPVAAGMILLAALIAIFAARPWIRMNPMEAVRHT